MSMPRFLVIPAALAMLAGPVLAQTATQPQPPTQQPVRPVTPPTAPAAPARPATPAVPAPAAPAAAAPATNTLARPTTPAPAAVTQPAKPVPAGQKVNLNTASAEELDKLPQIGPARSKAIIDARAKGRFKDWNDFVARNVVPSNAETAITDLVVIR
ncbi:MAG: ComEA family DNA-binding protein [Alsobacter sp.]